MGTLQLACCSFLSRESCSSPASLLAWSRLLGLAGADANRSLFRADISASVGTSSQWLLRCVHVQPVAAPPSETSRGQRVKKGLGFAPLRGRKGGFFIFLFFIFFFYKNIFLFSKFTEIYPSRAAAPGRPTAGRPVL